MSANPHAPHAPRADGASGAAPRAREALKPARQEDARLVTGLGRYTADWAMPGMAHGFVIRSDRPHARLVSVDVSAVREAPGVLAVLTAEDIAAAGFKAIPSGPPLKDREGQPMRAAPMPVLAHEVVRFVGQPIAMVIAETARAAQDAADLAIVEYDDLPVATTTADAGKPGAPQLHAHVPGNLAMTFDNGDAAAVDAAFAQAVHVSKVHVASQRLVGSPMELRGVMAYHDAARNKMVVHTPTQGILGMTNSLAAVTGWPPTELEVIAQDVGGSFGLRGGASAEHACVLLAARRLQRPVRWVGTRGESFVGEWHGRALVLDGEIALDRDGRILAIRFDDTADLGAYSAYFGAFVGSRNLAVTMGGVYRVPALHMRSRLWYTNTVPVSAYRGAGRPDIAFAIERLIDQACADHGLDPVAFRKKNFIPKDAFPYKTANGTTYDSGDFEGVLDHALALADWSGFAARRDEAARRGKLRGIGFACYLEASGGGGATDQVAARFGKDGRLTLYAVSGPSGQGHETSFAQIVSELTGIAYERIRYRASDPSVPLAGNGTGGSRTLYGIGSAFKNLGAALVERARPHAATALGVPEQAVEFVDGRFVVGRDGGAKSIGIAELAELLAGPSPHPLDCEAESVSGMTFPNGCHVAEIEIDPQTGDAWVPRYTAVDDLGTVVSPALARGQVHGGVVQGLGQAFGEQAIYDASGQLLTGSFMDYAMPRLGMIGEFRNDYHGVPTALNALGAKGVGESGCSGSLPAVANAMAQVLRSRGVGLIDMPYTPARLWAALQKA